jgi:putative Mg2+ transporter-C (MgtC) family protein
LEHSQIQILIEVALAMLLGAIIGFEREIAAKPAGLRTHMMVAGAAALLVALGDTMTHRFATQFADNVIQSDPVRIVEAIIAGTIIRTRGKGGVEGLTTAASLLLVAAIGVSVALAQYIVAVGVTVMALVVLNGLWWVDGWAKRLRQRRDDGEIEK